MAYQLVGVESQGSINILGDLFVCDDYVLFFFRQKTAYELRISDWSSDVCSSDLFENAYAFAMRGDDARARGIATLDDLARQAPRLTLGSDLEFLERPEWAAVRDAYGLRFAATQRYTPSFMYRALASGRADVISAFSSDGDRKSTRLNSSH